MLTYVFAFQLEKYIIISVCYVNKASMLDPGTTAFSSPQTNCMNSRRGGKDTLTLVKLVLMSKHIVWYLGLYREPLLTESVVNYELFQTTLPAVF